MVKIWRPLTQKELPDLSSGDTVVLRQNYLYNPGRLPAAYVAAQCVEKSKREATFVLEGSDKAILISLTEVGRYMDTGWQMSQSCALAIRFGFTLIPARFARPGLRPGLRLIPPKLLLKARPNPPRWGSGVLDGAVK